MSHDQVADRLTAEGLERRLREALRDCRPERDRIDAPIEVLEQARWLEQRGRDADGSVAAGWRRWAGRIMEAREIVAEVLFGLSCQSCDDWAAVLDLPSSLEPVAEPDPSPPLPPPAAPPVQGTLCL